MAKLRPRLTGLHELTADYFEQVNKDWESLESVRGADNVMNRIEVVAKSAPSDVRGFQPPRTAVSRPGASCLRPHPGPLRDSGLRASDAAWGLCVGSNKGDSVTQLNADVFEIPPVL